MMPLMNIMKSEEVCICYFKEVAMMFMFNVMLAMGVEYSNLHTRIALLCIKCIGVNPRFLQLSIISITWFLSFWMSQIAVLAMMMPIVKAIIEELSVIGNLLYVNPIELQCNKVVMHSDERLWYLTTKVKTK